MHTQNSRLYIYIHIHIHMYIYICIFTHITQQLPWPKSCLGCCHKLWRCFFVFSTVEIMAIRPTTVTCTDRKNPCSLRKVFQPPYFARFVIMLVYCIYFWMPDDASHHSLGLKLLEVYVYIYIYMCVCVCVTQVGLKCLSFGASQLPEKKISFLSRTNLWCPASQGCIKFVWITIVFGKVKK